MSTCRAGASWIGFLAVGRLTARRMFVQTKLQDKHVYTGCATVRSLADRGVRLKQSEGVRSADMSML